MRENMDDRVSAWLISEGLSSGMDSEQAIAWAESRKDSTQAAMMRLSLVADDARAAVGGSVAQRTEEIRRAFARVRGIR